MSSNQLSLALVASVTLQLLVISFLCNANKLNQFHGHCQKFQSRDLDQILSCHCRKKIDDIHQKKFVAAFSSTTGICTMLTSPQQPISGILVCTRASLHLLTAFKTDCMSPLMLEQFIVQAEQHWGGCFMRYHSTNSSMSTGPGNTTT